MSTSFFSAYAKRLFLLTALAIGLFCCFLVVGQATAQAGQPLDVGLDQAAETGLVQTDIRIVIARIIRAALGLLGIVAVGLVLYGGYMYMTAGGNEDRVLQAKRILMNAGVGLIIIMSAFGIVTFVMNRLVDAVNGGGKTIGLEGDLGGGDEEGGDGSGFSRAFYVVSLPQSGPVCVSNVNPQIVFNKPVTVATVQSAIVVANKATGDTIPGSWRYGGNQSTVVFVPVGSCGSEAGSGNDCFAPNTEFTITFVRPTDIKTLNADPEQSLNCRYKAGCGQVTFKSGESVDRVPPTITITYPKLDTDISAGSVVAVKVTYTDDNGVQGVALMHDNKVVDSVSLAGCKKTEEISLDWPVGGSLTGQQTISARATDWAGHEGTDDQIVSIKPAHCANGILEINLGEERLGPPECGGSCGACSGGSCSASNQCASGSCVNGVCANVMKISGFSPASGAAGTLVSISGKYFGTTPGKVFFATKENPVVGTTADWKEAVVAKCGTSVAPWSASQILVEVPEGVANFSHIKVQTSGVSPAIDSTASHPELRAFEVNNLVRPRVCAVSPGNGKSGTPVTIVGEKFGELTTANDKVVFGSLNAVIVRAANNSFSWVDNRIVATVPGIEQGAVGVKVIKNNIESNSVRFFVDAGVTSDSPVISDLSPGRGAEGEYITISGDNFGKKLGSVWFKEAANSPAILGDFSFPADCSGSVWDNTKIIVKFPKGKGVVGKTYYVQVNSADNKTSNLSQNKVFLLESGTPKPGICKISPTSGPIPYPDGQSVTLAGEYFLSSEGTPGKIFFWNVGASSPDTTTGREPVPAEGVVSITANTAVVVPPKNTASGPVSIFRANDQEISNPVQFNVFDCREKTSECSAEQHCCLNGNEAGVCKPVGEFCSGEVLTAGYVWRFATQDIPPVPHVLERCDETVDAGQAIPSPSPNIRWDREPAGVHHNVCRNALVTVEFTSALDAATINNNSLKLNKCSGVDKTTCFDPEPVDFSYELVDAFSDGQTSRQYLEITPKKTWADDSWFQVVLTNKIQSPARNGVAGVALAADASCGGDSAYCFVFKSGNADCRLKTVAVTPYSYVAQVLEAPISRHLAGDTFPVDYRGVGVADQRCVVMDTRSLDWQWSSSDSSYAAIHGVGTRQVENIDSLANTVGVGLRDDAVAISVKGSVVTSDGLITKEGKSPLVIDLSNPAIMEYWPNCLEVCTNAEVGLRFNVSMSTRNYNTGVKLLKCNDENCFETVEVSSPKTITMPEETGGTIIKLANNSTGSSELEPNSLYQVVVSVTSTKPLDSTEILWSRARSSDASSYSKPFNKQFTWRFRTKKEKCQISRADVLPKQYIARLVNDKSVFGVQPYSAPDSCSAQGQKLNAWEVSWNWQSSDAKVAELRSFATRGKSSFCTASCIVKGSTLAASGKTVPVCGNGKVEPGEDCEEPNASKGCSLDCRWIGKSSTSKCGNGIVEYGEACDTADEKTKLGCSTTCQRLGSEQKTAAQDISASICGNGTVGAGEDCDLGISERVSNRSSQNCSATCLHTGTRLSTKWCFDHDRDLAGFTHENFKAACDQAYSQCGDGVQNPDEDPGCDLGEGKFASWCNNVCLKNSIDKPECTVGAEGCTATAQHAGASLAYSEPSVCGDGQAGLGEDVYCEKTVTITRDRGLFDPWALVRAVGRGASTGNPASQKALITAMTTQNTAKSSVKGSADFVIKCGYRTDVDCKIAMGNAKYGVGDDSCCYARTNLLSTYPANRANNVCRNTYINAKFDGLIRQSTLPGNFIIARGIRSGSCTASTTDVTSLLALQTPSETSGPWYRRAWNSATNFFRGLFGSDALADVSSVTRWCAGEDLGEASVLIDQFNTSSSYINVVLNEPLAGETDYAVIIKKEVKDSAGVRMGKTDVSWTFTTAGKICEVDAVTVEPDAWYFSKSGATTTLVAAAHTGGVAGDLIQPVNGYSWEYIWQPGNNASVSISLTTSTNNRIEAKNVQGEVDIRATARITENNYTSKTGTLAFGTSHITVALCENPWPPKDAFVSGKHVSILPYEDVEKNNDAFDVAAKVFTGVATPAAYGYFNFSTFYCADAGVTGTFDDLPYLHPAVQSNTEQIKDVVGSCESSGDSCSSDDDCGSSYGTSQGTLIVAGNSTNVCGALPDTNHPTGQYFLGSGGETIVCASDADCSAHSDLTTWAKNNNLNYGCIALPSATRKELRCFKNPPLKRFIFTPTHDKTSNGDAIGIQIFANSRHLPVEEWYRQDKSRGGQGFVGTLQNLTVAGYPAVSDGNNIYVDALNYSNNRLFSNIYLFSINSNAKSETRSVFEQIIKNLGLNRNIKNNEGYCGPSITEPAFEKECLSDLDCSGGQVCANQLDKLKRDYRRLLDLKVMDTMLVNYANSNSGKFPTVASGSFLPGQSLSTWDWAGLANVIGKSLPKDPVNSMGRAGTCTKEPSKFCVSDANCSANDTCLLHDPGTGWSVADKRFSFACATTSYGYRYKFTTTTGFIISTKMEDVGLKLDVNSLNAFVRGFDFSDDKRFRGIFFNEESAGICDSGAEISSVNQGTCGDGVVNVAKGEQCDPGNSVIYDRSRCRIDGTGEATATTCTATCRLGNVQTVSCVDRQKCGNNKIDSGEVCDDGLLNGQWNKCNSRCTGKVAKQPDGPGYCGDTVVQSKFEICDSGRVAQPGVNEATYGLTKVQSCAWDCQKFGPYCGDGIVQKEYGEECDGSATCSLAGTQGEKTCSSVCKFLDKTATSWWKLASSSASGLEFEDSMGARVATCVGDSCPTLESTGGPKGTGSVRFDGIQDKLTVAHNASLMPTSTLSVEAWIKPSDYSRSYQRLVEKGGFAGQTQPGAFRSGANSDGGYSLEFNNFSSDSSKHLVAFTVWDRSGHSRLVLSTTTIPLNTWTYVVGTYEWRNGSESLKMYVNGKLETVATFDALVEPMMYSNTAPLTIGRSSGGYDAFGGSMANVKVANRVLQPEEIKDRFENIWACSVPPKTSATIAAGSCGNAIVDSGEACDLGVEKNGVQCSAAYGQSCQFCSADCKSAQNIRANQYCGNGIIETGETCETDQATGQVYLGVSDPTSTVSVKDANHNGYPAKLCIDEVSEPLTFRKGTKTCSADCKRVVIAESGGSSCTRCGIDLVNGKTVSGSLVNIIDVKTANPLFAVQDTGSGGMSPQEIILGYQVTASGFMQSGTELIKTNYALGPIVNKSYYDASTTYQLASRNGSSGAIVSRPLNTDPICYNGVGKSYKLGINTSVPFDFPVYDQPTTWQYDQILSPYISSVALLDRAAQPMANTARPNDMRISISWVGSNDFKIGLVKPAAGSNNPPTMVPPTSLAAGYDYFTKPFSDVIPGSFNVWYHGASTTPGGLSIETYTIDTSKMVNNNYFVYVKTLSNTMKNLKGANTRLKVDVYLPQNRSRYFFVYDKPYKTFYITGADSSTENLNAQYWHVFTINKLGATMPDRINKATSYDPSSGVVSEYDSGRFVSGPAFMR